MWLPILQRHQLRLLNNWYQESGLMKKYGNIGLLVLIITGSGLSLADCPNSMPQQLLQDCIVYEGAGTTFPSSDYAYMDEYIDWINTQKMQIASNRKTNKP